jgi:hypothetical protein
MATDARMEYAGFNQLAADATAACQRSAKRLLHPVRQDADGVDQDQSVAEQWLHIWQFHLNAARRAKLSQPRLDLVAVWRDAAVFSARERATLAWTEVVTHVTAVGARRSVQQRDERVRRE